MRALSCCQHLCLLANVAVLMHTYTHIALHADAACIQYSCAPTRIHQMRHKATLNCIWFMLATAMSYDCCCDCFPIAVVATITALMSWNRYPYLHISTRTLTHSYKSLPRQYPASAQHPAQSFSSFYSISSQLAGIFNISLSKLIENKFKYNCY